MGVWKDYVIKSAANNIRPDGRRCNELREFELKETNSVNHYKSFEIEDGGYTVHLAVDLKVVAKEESFFVFNTNTKQLESLEEDTKDSLANYALVLRNVLKTFAEVNCNTEKLVLKPDVCHWQVVCNILSLKKGQLYIIIEAFKRAMGQLELPNIEFPCDADLAFKYNKMRLSADHRKDLQIIKDEKMIGYNIALLEGGEIIEDPLDVEYAEADAIISLLKSPTLNLFCNSIGKIPLNSLNLIHTAP